MADQATPEQMNRFVAEVDKFFANYAKLNSPAMQTNIYASGDQSLINEYTALRRDGARLQTDVNNLVGAWGRFKQTYTEVTDYTSTVIGDAIDWLRGVFGTGPAADLEAYGAAAPISAGELGQWRGGGTLGQWRGGGTIGAYGAASPISAGTLGALGLLPVVLSAAAVAAIVGAAYLWNQRAERVFISTEADKIQRQDPTKSRSDAINEAAGAVREPLFGDVGLPLLIAAGALVAFFFWDKR